MRDMKIDTILIDKFEIVGKEISQFITKKIGEIYELKEDLAKKAMQHLDDPTIYELYSEDRIEEVGNLIAQKLDDIRENIEVTITVEIEALSKKK
jgi:hypothetical protein